MISAGKFFISLNIAKVILLEKFTPTYDLEEFKRSDFKITFTAKKSAADLGFDLTDIDEVVSTMKNENFYKSMTSYANHKIWQDVYHVPYEDLILYIKFTKNTISEFTLLSFKGK